MRLSAARSRVIRVRLRLACAFAEDARGANPADLGSSAGTISAMASFLLRNIFSRCSDRITLNLASFCRAKGVLTSSAKEPPRRVRRSASSMSRLAPDMSISPVPFVMKSICVWHGRSFSSCRN